MILSDGITSIGDLAFSGCVYLDEVCIPDSVTSIEKFTFDNCRYLNEVRIPNGVVSIADAAFVNCNLESVLIPDSVSYLSERAFDYNTDCIKTEGTPLYIHSSANGEEGTMDGLVVVARQSP